MRKALMHGSPGSLGTFVLTAQNTEPYAVKHSKLMTEEEGIQVELRAPGQSKTPEQKAAAAA